MEVVRVNNQLTVGGYDYFDAYLQTRSSTGAWSDGERIYLTDPNDDALVEAGAPWIRSF